MKPRFSASLNFLKLKNFPAYDTGSVRYVTGLGAAYGTAAYGTVRDVTGIGLIGATVPYRKDLVGRSVADRRNFSKNKSHNLT